MLMAVLIPEYAVHELRASDSKFLARYGPYDSLAEAKRQRDNGESIDHNDRAWIVVERSITDWEPVPTKVPHWPTDD